MSDALEVILDGPVEMISVDALEHHPRNARQGDVGAIVASIEEHGIYRPLIVQRSTSQVVAGNHTLKAARALGYTEVPVQFIDVDDDEAVRILIVDNRTNDLATYDDHAMAELLSELATATDRALTGTGFSGDDLDDLLRGLDLPPLPPITDPDPEPPIPPLPENPETQRGDLWEIGPHRLICGDARDTQDVARLLAGEPIGLAFTSPPYAQQRVYDEASGFAPIAPEEYVAWYAAIAANIAEHLVDDGSSFVNIKPAAEELDTLLYVFDLVLAHVREWGWHFATEFCWERTGVPKHVTRRFKNQYEPIYQFTRGDWQTRFHPDDVRHWSDSAIHAVGNGGEPAARGQGGSPVGDSARERGRATQLASLPDSTTMGKVQGIPSGPNVGKAGRARGGDHAVLRLTKHGTMNPASSEGRIHEGWAYPGNRLPSFAKTHEAVGHSAAFPIGLPQFFVTAYSNEHDVVYDPFMGSGSTMLAAHKMERRGFGVEISPAYCDVTLMRVQRHTGLVPTRDGKPHDFSVA